MSWLVRTTQNEILGPFDADELKRRIAAREFAPEDEICEGNRYWIYLREKAEVKAQLGIEVAFRHDPLAHSDSEPTQTQIASEAAAAPELPELDAEALNSEETSLIRSRAIRGAPGASTPPAPARPSRREAAQLPVARTVPVYRERTGAGIEGPLVVRGMAWVLAAGAGALVYWVIRLLESNPR